MPLKLSLYLKNQSSSIRGALLFSRGATPSLAATALFLVLQLLIAAAGLASVAQWMISGSGSLMPRNLVSILASHSCIPEWPPRATKSDVPLIPTFSYIASVSLQTRARASYGALMGFVLAVPADLLLLHMLATPFSRFCRLALWGTCLLA